VALLALLKAVERFDPDYGFSFGSFAEPTIIGELRRHFRDATWPVHVSRRGQELQLVLASTRERVAQELGRSPTPAELATAMGVTVDDVLLAIQAANAYRTTPIDASQPLVDGRFAAADTRLTLDLAIEALSERDRQVIGLRFVTGLTQSEIGGRVGMSQVHVSRVLRATVAALRDRLEADDAYDAS
jgi:RNA polymerase sigma-B factor